MYYPKSFISLSVLFSLLLISFFISSCSNNNPIINNPVPIRVEGFARNTFGQPLAGIIVKINNSTYVTQPDGKFIFENVMTPYSMIVKDTAFNSNYLYKDLTTPYPSITASFMEQSNPVAGINVSLPAGSSNGKLIFTNYDDVNSYGFINSDLRVRTLGHNSVTGALIVLLYTEENGKITDYTHFGVKENLTISPGENYNVNFSASELSFNPAEETFTGTVVAPQSPDYTNTFGFISFSNYQFPEYMMILSLGNVQELNFNFVLPANLPIQCKKMIGAISYNDSKGFMTNVNSMPGNITLTGPASSSLISPENNATGVNASTVLKYTPVNANSIYAVQINTSTVYTNKTEFTLGELEQLGFDLNTSQTLTWRVSSIGPYNSTDEFVNRPPKVDKFYVPSESRTITTAGK